MKNIKLQLILRKVSVSMLLFIGVCLSASISAYAKENYTCTGGHLYYDVQQSDGTWNCVELKSGCDKTKEWSVTFDRKIRPRGTSVTAPTEQIAPNARRAALDKTQAIAALTSFTTSDIKLFYNATNVLLVAYHKRAHFPPSSESIVVFEDQTPQWIKDLLNPGHPAQAMTEGKICPDGTYPNPLAGDGVGCYPCLGCHPCGTSYCDNKSTATAMGVFTNDDLSPALRGKGYALRDGKIYKIGVAGSPKTDKAKN